jgi:hypothetical protein
VLLDPVPTVRMFGSKTTSDGANPMLVDTGW